MIARLTIRYLLLFIVVLTAVSAVAYAMLARMYAGYLQPALGTPEYAVAYGTAMHRVLSSIALFDVPLLVVFGGVAYVLARSALGPLLAARERERRFAAEAAHELRSPLATIATVAQAARAQTGPQVQASLETIARTALDASAIVSDLLTLAREPGAHALSLETLDLAILARQVADEFHERARAANITLEVDAASALVSADERRIRELLRNLLENGLRHARSRLTVRTQQSGKTALLRVEDDGPGIEPSLQERVFDRFYRENASSEGLGLGLSIGRWIARAHGGDLHAASAQTHGGAAFTLRLPALGA